MNDSILLGLIHNIAILLAFSLIYDYSWLKNEESKGILKKILAGTIIGGLGIILMMTPWTLIPGIVFDTRSILLSVSGLFFGTVPTLVAMLITGTYRVILGGDGVWMGIAVILSSGTIGILWKAIRPAWSKKYYVPELLLMGIVVHAIMAGCAFLLPPDSIMRTLKEITLPLIIIYSPGTMLLGMLMVKQFNNWQNRKAKEHLIESERRFTEMLRSVNLFSIILDVEGRVTFCNPYFLQITGYSEAEVIGCNWFDNFTPAESNKKNKDDFWNYINGKIIFTYYENEVIAKNKELHLISWNNTLLRNTNGAIIGMASIGENITTRRAAEEQKLQFANILEASLNEIYVFDAETLHFKYVNFGALSNMGYSLEQIKTLTSPDIQPDYKPADYRKLILPLSKHEKSLIIYESRNRRCDGTYYPVEVRLQLFEYSTESVFLAVVQDITSRKKAENQLIEARKKAEENDKLKSIFLANMSHEIRTPMNAIIGFSSLLSSPGIEDVKKIAFGEIISNASNRLMHIIDDILDISKLEAKQLTLSLTVFNIFELLNKSILAFKKSELLKNKPSLELSLNYPDNQMNLKIRSDHTRLQQVLDNLISNAIKYTDNGNIEVGLAVKNENKIRFAQVYVKDSGKGIPKEMNKLVFERFRQIEEKVFHEGAGLGLSISKGLIELLGGKIWFTSELNKGTTFYFTIPLISNDISLQDLSDIGSGSL